MPQAFPSGRPDGGQDPGCQATPSPGRGKDNIQRGFCSVANALAQPQTASVSVATQILPGRTGRVATGRPPLDGKRSFGFALAGMRMAVGAQRWQLLARTRGLAGKVGVEGAYQLTRWARSDGARRALACSGLEYCQCP